MMYKEEVVEDWPDTEEINGNSQRQDMGIRPHDRSGLDDLGLYCNKYCSQKKEQEGFLITKHW